MKELLSLVATLAFCVSCSKNVPVATQPTESKPACNDASCPLPDAGKVADPISDLIQEENWKFTLTGSGWVPGTPPDDAVKVVFRDSQSNLEVFLVKETTTQTYQQYVFNILRSFKAAEMVVSSAKQVSINGNNLMSMAAHNDDESVWIWVMVDKGTAYIFSCTSGDIDAGAFADRCVAIANSLEIK